jgi:hypothetical protein
VSLHSITTGRAHQSRRYRRHGGAGTGADVERRTIVSVGRSSALAAATFILASCSSQQACTLIGGISGAAFDLSGAAIPENATVRACVQAHCKEFTSTNVRAGLLDAPDYSLNSAAAPVAVTVRSGAGAAMLQLAGVVHPTKGKPNGPKCPPTVWRAIVRTNGGTLVQTAG